MYELNTVLPFGAVSLYLYIYMNFNKNCRLASGLPVYQITSEFLQPRATKSEGIEKKENHGIIWIMVILGPRALSLLHFVEVMPQTPHVFERKMQLTWHMDGDLAAAAPLEDKFQFSDLDQGMSLLF